MINRTLSRIRVFQELFALAHSSEKSNAEIRKELSKSFTQSHLLYLFLLQLPAALTALHAEIIEHRQTKLLRNYRDENPNMRLANNLLAKKIDDSETLNDTLYKAALSWRSNDTLLHKLLNEILNSDLYRNYCNDTTYSLEVDVNFWVAALQRYCFKNEALDEFLEDTSIYWDNPARIVEKIYVDNKPTADQWDEVIDEAKESEDTYHAVRLLATPVEIEKDFALKTLRRSANNASLDELLMPVFKSEEDQDFPYQLLSSVMVHNDSYTQDINELLQNWESERLNDTDIIILKMGIAEFFTFNNIPATVTINEYIELAKNYSTPKSGQFINGLLDKLLAKYREEKRINK